MVPRVTEPFSKHSCDVNLTDITNGGAGIYKRGLAAIRGPIPASVLSSAGHLQPKQVRTA